MTQDDFSVPGPGSAELLARAGWLEFQDDILGGLCHDLNSRVASVAGLLQLLELGASDAPQTLAYLGPETERLERIADLLGCLSGRADAPPEAFELAELVTRALPLLACHRPLASVEVRLQERPALAPVRASRPRLLRALLLTLRHASATARTSGVGTVDVELDESDGKVALRVGWADGDRRWDPASADGAWNPLGQLLALDGGELHLEPGAVRVTLPGLRRG